MRGMFGDAQREGAVLLLDEADSFLRSREALALVAEGIRHDLDLGLLDLLDLDLGLLSLLGIGPHLLRPTRSSLLLALLLRELSCGRRHLNIHFVEAIGRSFIR